MAALGEILRMPLDWVLPERCPACGAITGEGGDFCARCWQKLHFLTPPWCASCAVPLPFERDDALQCASCLAKPPRHDGIRAVVAYDDISRQVALRLKYGGKIGLARVIATQLDRQLPDDRRALLIVPVPLHWTRLWTRSFNQSALIADALARQSELSTIPDLLLRTRRTPSLRGLSGKERKKVVGSAFTVNPRYADRLKHARVILVDDVLTSGATSDACINALKRGGADWVQLFCWARVLYGEQQPVDMPPGLDA